MSSSSSFLPGLLNQLRQSRQFGLGHVRRRGLEQRGNGLDGRTLEEGVDQVLERRAFRALAADARHIEVAWTILLVPHVALVFEDAQHRAHGRIAGRIGEPVEDLRGGRAAAAVQDVHDLPLAAAEV